VQISLGQAFPFQAREKDLRSRPYLPRNYTILPESCIVIISIQIYPQPKFNKSEIAQGAMQILNAIFD
jgi:hypothetical protein